jgi:hypothetical protein
LWWEGKHAFYDNKKLKNIIVELKPELFKYVLKHLEKVQPIGTQMIPSKLDFNRLLQMLEFKKDAELA